VDEITLRRVREIRAVQARAEGRVPARTYTQAEVDRMIDAALARAGVKATPPTPEPAPKIDLMAPGSPASDMAEWRRARGLPDDPAIVHIDLPVTARSPNAAGLGALQHQPVLEERRQAREQELAVGAVDLKDASRATAVERLRKLGAADDVLNSIREHAPVPSLQDLRLGDKQRYEVAEMRAAASAESELNQAELEATQQRISLDTRRLSPGAFQLYQRRRGLSVG